MPRKRGGFLRPLWRAADNLDFVGSHIRYSSLPRRIILSS